MCLIVWRNHLTEHRYTSDRYCWVIILQFQGGLLQAPLNPLKTDVSRGPPGLSGRPGPLWPHRNSTTADRHQGHGVVIQRIRVFGDKALYKSTFYLLTYLFTYHCPAAAATWPWVAVQTLGGRHLVNTGALSLKLRYTEVGLDQAWLRRRDNLLLTASDRVFTSMLWCCWLATVATVNVNCICINGITL